MANQNRMPVRRGSGPTRYVLIRLPRISRTFLIHVALFLAGVGLTAGIQAQWESAPPKPISPFPEPLYLLETAAEKMDDPVSFEQKVRMIAEELAVAPEWLMAVMYAESGFEAGIHNRKGSGAVGLIQFMPTTARELGTTSQALAQMDAVGQLDYVAAYFAQVKARYGPYQNLTDLYLAVLYPKARQQDYCFSLYARPLQAYRQNAGLDENKDGKVTISDVHTRMLRLFPEAYVARPKTSAFSS